MKIIKIILIVLAVILGLYLIITLFLPSRFRYEVSEEINAPANAIFQQINILRHWEEWDPWMKHDTSQYRSYSEQSSGVGTAYHWISKNPDVGKGSLTIVESKPYEYIKLKLKFEDWGTSDVDFTLKENNGVTQVIWGMETEFDFFFRIMGLLMKSSIEKDFKQGLAKLKEIIENSPYKGYNISIEISEATNIYFISDSTDTESIQNSLSATFQEIFAFARKNNIEIAGSPIAITKRWDNNFWVYDAAVPVKSITVKPTGRIKTGRTYEGEVVKLIYIGAYEDMEPAYDAIIKFIEDHNYTIAGNSWETYINSPQNTPIEKLETHIYFPIIKKAK